VLDLLDLRYLRQLGDVERAVVERDAVRTVKVLGDDLHLAFAVLLDDRVKLIERPVADEYCSSVAEPQRTRIGNAARINLDLEPLRHLELVQRQLVGGRCERRRRYRGKSGRRSACSASLLPGLRRGRLLGKCRRSPKGERADRGRQKQPALV